MEKEKSGIDKQEDQAQKKEKKKKFNPVQEMPHLYPEPDYIIKTRPPMWDDWRLNIFRGVKENRLKLEANKIARRKCWETGGELDDCSVRFFKCKFEYLQAKKSIWGIWDCKKEFNNFLNCCYHEYRLFINWS